METPVNLVLSVSKTFNLPQEGTPEWYALYKQLMDRIKSRYADSKIDICSTMMYELGDNLVFQYKVVPAWAPSMSTYPYEYAILIREHLVEPLEL